MNKTRKKMIFLKLKKVQKINKAIRRKRKAKRELLNNVSESKDTSWSKN